MSEPTQLIMLPGPTNVHPQVMRAMIKPIINHRGPEFKELYLRILKNCKAVFETKSDVIVLSASGSGGIEAATSSISNPKTKFLVPVHGVFSERLRDAAGLFGARAVGLPVDWGKAVTVDQIEETLKKEKDVTAVAVVYNETSTGVTTRALKEIGELCREKGLLYIVDAISILGGDSLPVDDWHIDICVTGSQKCLMTPPGISMISISEKAWDAIKQGRKNYYFDLPAYKKYEEEGQTPYTPALPLLYALDEALRMILKEGLEHRFRRHRVCGQALYTGLEAAGLKLFADPRDRSNVVISVNNPPKISDKDIRDRLIEKYHVVIAGGMGKLKGSIFRIGSMGTVSPADILQTLNALELTLNDLGFGNKLGAATTAAKQVFHKEGFL